MYPLIFKRLLLKLTTDCTFVFDSSFYKQVEGCSMGGPLSVTLSDIFMVKMENDIVVPTKPKLFKRYVDDIINKRRKDVADSLFESLNNYHPNINLTIEIKPTKFLDTKIIYGNTGLRTEVYRKETKLPVPWNSEIPKKYKRNVITADLHRAKRISSNFNSEIVKIKQKFSNAGYPQRFIWSNINNFTNKSLEETEYIIPPWLFKIPKKFMLIELPYCHQNEKISHHFLTKLKSFTNNQYDFAIKWNTRKIKTLFPLKDKNTHPSCCIYKGTCACGLFYIGETKRNVQIRWKEHQNPKHNSEIAKHLYQFNDHVMSFKVIANASNNVLKRRILEAFYIAQLKPNLNDQLDSQSLKLFRYGIT